MAAASKATPVLMELCTASGLKVIDVAPFVGALEETPATPHVMEEACAYCTLLPPLPFIEYERHVAGPTGQRINHHR